MQRVLGLVLALFLCSAASGQSLTYADLKAKNGVQLSADDLTQLLPGARVISRTNAGSTRNWVNKPDGTLTAASDGRGSSGGRNSYGTGAGTWKTNDNGRWCVTIKWPNIAEEWCRVMFKVDNRYYGVGRLEDNAPASEFEISR
ncbi:MAG: hypothetical protein ABI537_16310 [Casimicrobiaceae bacterium]